MENIQEVVIFITAPNEEEASTLARTLVDARLAACVNIVRDVRSIYRWQGKIEDDQEVLMVVKTCRDCISGLTEKVTQLHSYEVPEVIVLPIIGGSQDYIQWLKESTKQ